MYFSVSRFSLLVVTLLSVCWTQVEAKCEDAPFNIEVTLVPKADGGELTCDKFEKVWIAKEIARDINYVVIKSHKDLGVVQSQTRVCKEGEIVPKDMSEQMFDDEDDDDGGRRLVEQSHRALGYSNFIYRGSGHCTFCSGDNRDGRRFLKGPRGGHGRRRNLKSEVIDTVSSESLTAYDPLALESGGSTSPQAKPTATAEEDDGKKDKDDKKDKKDKKDKDDGTEEFKYDDKKGRDTDDEKNGFGEKDFYFVVTDDYEVGFYHVDGEDRYYYYYKPEKLNLEVLGQILSDILKFKLTIWELNQHLCTWGSVEDIVVSLTPTETFEIPKCPAVHSKIKTH